MKAILISYDGYDQYAACEEANPDDANETWAHTCESDITSSDAYASDNSDQIDGSANIFHDIRVSQMMIHQGFEASGEGLATSVVSPDDDAELNVGYSYFQVEVEHRGSDQSELYDWNVTLTMTDSAGVVTTETSNSCMAIDNYAHAQLGIGAPEPGMEEPAPFGSACILVELSSSGEHTFSAELVMEGTKTSDARPSNNDLMAQFNVRNNAPLITSLEALNEGDLYIGQEDVLAMAIEVFDVDQPSGDGLEIEWKHSGEVLLGCQRSPATFCTIDIQPEYATTFIVDVTVFDMHGGSTTEALELFIWNSITATASTDSSLTLAYSIKYNAKSQFMINATDGNIGDYEDVSLAGYSGTYNAVGAIAYDPVTTFTAVDVLSQSMKVHFPKSLEATSLWYVSDSGQWQMISNVINDIDATTGEYAYVFPADTAVLPQGTLVLMGGVLAQADVPAATVTGFSAAAARLGAIQLNWEVVGTMLTGDSIDVTICEGAAGCDDAFKVGLAVGDSSYTYAGSNIVHGILYNVLVAVCNEVGCSTPVGSADVVADKEVDGNVLATDLTIAAAGDDWTVSWTASGDQSDVAEWNVCWQKNTFDAANMPSNCDTTTTTSATIAMPMTSGTFTYHFTAVPVDSLGNSAAAASMNSIDYQRDADNTNTDDGSDIVGDEVSSGVPTWTWGVIGGVVVVAFIVGAFILSRGGDGDEGKDWDY
jgi:hypothetical protein